MNLNRIGFHRVLIFLVVAACSLTIACRGSKHVSDDPLIADLFQFYGKESGEAFLQLHALGKTAIPRLIAAIDTDSSYVVPYQNPVSSYIPDGLFELRAGVRAAHLIELILAWDSIIPPPNRDFYLGPLGYAGENYIFVHGMVVRDGKPRGLTMVEMQELKALYQKWWNANNGKSLSQLRQQWRDGNRPLTDSPYEWW